MSPGSRRDEPAALAGVALGLACLAVVFSG